MSKQLRKESSEVIPVSTVTHYSAKFCVSYSLHTRYPVSSVVLTRMHKLSNSRGDHVMIPKIVVTDFF